MLKNFHDSCSDNDNIFFFNENFSKVKFYANQLGIFGMDNNKTNFNDDNTFYEDDPDCIIHV